jgi:hypothetical protein
MTSRIRNSTCALAFSLACGFAAPASASLVFTLSGGDGTITLTDGTGTGAGGNGIATGSVQLSETLTPNVFAVSGAGDALEFSLASTVAAITASGISNLSFTGASPTAPSSLYGFDPSPTKPKGVISHLEYGINCTSCGNGTSPPEYNALSFVLAGVQSSDFIAGDSAGEYFLSDIGIVTTGSVQSTGLVGATGPGTTSPPTLGGGGDIGVPEPVSINLLAVGLVALGLARRRKHG